MNLAGWKRPFILPFPPSLSVTGLPCGSMEVRPAAAPRGWKLTTAAPSGILCSMVWPPSPARRLRNAGQTREPSATRPWMHSFEKPPKEICGTWMKMRWTPFWTRFCPPFWRGTTAVSFWIRPGEGQRPPGWSSP
ncbi:hypothetical protein SDC9_207626 [bioreactor metagenome]|uniref:Uncharacterized protein n=1 Tax=bioreactor metagenome TaxID=1076179 RepID=A0A645JHT1_9ZZZZ